jgi:hypothetical protein
MVEEIDIKSRFVIVYIKHHEFLIQDTENNWWGGF